MVFFTLHVSKNAAIFLSNIGILDTRLRFIAKYVQKTSIYWTQNHYFTGIMSSSKFFQKTC